MNIKWTDKITNKELWRITHQQSIEHQIKRRKWNLTGHTFTYRNRSNRENCIRLESSGIQKERLAEQNVAKDNRG
jgi:hypothetical protein